MFEQELKIIDYINQNIKITEPIQSVFQAISDFFYRENFHSDILAYYLSFDLVKEKLIQWIEKNNNIHIYPELYKNAPSPVREEGRRDITIYSKNKTNAIIIENKSNGADDMPRQIIGYYEDLEKNNVKVDAIVYLNKRDIKYPSDFYEWTTEEQEKINKILLISTLNNQNSFVDNVINPTLQDSNDIKLSGLSLEIRNLFINIINGENGMADSNCEELMKILDSKDNYEKLTNFITLYNNLSFYMRDYYMNKMKNLISDNINIGIYQRNCFYIDKIMINGINYAIDFVFVNNTINISILTRNTDIEDQLEQLTSLKTLMGNNWPFGEKVSNSRYFYNFNFPFNTDAVVKEFKKILESFNTLCTTIKS